MGGNSSSTLVSLINFLEDRLLERPVRAQVNRMVQEGKSSAGRRHEEVFTREFLCPVIADYFYKVIRASLNLSDEQIRSGLGTEGFEKCDGFGFTPARKSPHLFTKSDIIKSRPPQGWTGNAVPGYQACPDFAIRKPLPLSVVGEVKYFKKGSHEKAIKELYDGARQAVFYLATFLGEYDNALLVIGDASLDHALDKAVRGLHDDLLSRFGDSTHVYLLVLPLTDGDQERTYSR